MTSQLSAVTNVAIDALVADGSLTAALGSAKVYSHVPQDTVAPFVVVVGGREVPWAEALNEDTDREVEVLVLIYSAYRGTKELDTIVDLVGDVLTDESEWAALSGFLGCRYVGSERPMQVELGGQVYWTRQAAVLVWVSPPLFGGSPGSPGGGMGG